MCQAKKRRRRRENIETNKADEEKEGKVRDF
jgi:hypothetical protein